MLIIGLWHHSLSGQANLAHADFFVFIMIIISGAAPAGKLGIRSHKK